MDDREPEFASTGEPEEVGTKMSVTQTALMVGLVLGVVAAFGGFGAFVIVLLFGAVGLVVGLVLEGSFDPASLVGRLQRK